MKKAWKDHQPPHGFPNGFDCGCICCDDWRLKRLIPGALVKYISLDPSKYSGPCDRATALRVDAPVIWNRSWDISIPALYMGRVPKCHQADYISGAIVFIPGLGIRVVHGKKLYVVSV